MFFPVTFLYGVSRFLFSALALAVVLALFASYFVAMTVVPLFCAKLIKAPHARDESDETPGGNAAPRPGYRFNAALPKTSRTATSAAAKPASLRAPSVIVLAVAGRLRGKPAASTRCSAWPSSRAPTPASSSST